MITYNSIKPIAQVIFFVYFCTVSKEYNHISSFEKKSSKKFAYIKNFSYL